MGFKPGNQLWKTRSKWTGEGGIGIDGYRRVCSNGKRIREHRLVMEKFIGRKLLRNEIVHHIDGDKKNNDIKNLQLMTFQQHCIMHTIERKRNNYGQFKNSESRSHLS